VRSNALESRFHDVQRDGLSSLAVFVPGKRGNAVSPTFIARFRLAFRKIPCTIPPCARTTDWRVIRMPARSRAGPGGGASPAAVSRRGTLGVTARLPNAANLLVADSEMSTTVCYQPRWLAGAGTAVRGCRDGGRGDARTRSVTALQDLSALRNYGRLPSSEARIIASRRPFMDADCV
jgi:hypothetical protein